MLQGADTSPEFPSQIEITLITAHSPAHLHNVVERIVHHLELVQLRKISAVVITNPDRLVGQGGLGGGTDDGDLGGGYEDHERDHVTTSKSDLGEYVCVGSEGVEPLYNYRGQVGPLSPYREVVLFSEVTNVL